MGTAAQERATETIEVEKKLLGALFVDEGAAAPKIMEMLTVEDFYRAEHRIIFSAMCQLTDAAVPIDYLLVENKIQEMGKANLVNRMYLIGLLELEYTTAYAEHYATIIKDKSRRRQLESIGRELIDESHHERKTVSEILSAADKKLTAVVTTTARKSVPFVDGLKDTLTEILNRKEGLVGVPSGFYDFDRMCGGLKKSDLIILAARPSMGKTALALNIATEAASRGNSTLIFSLEMSRNQLNQRILSATSKIPATKIQQGILSDRERESLISHATNLENLKLHIDDTAGISLSDLKMEARRVKREHGLDLIVVDYLQLMQETRAENRQQEVSAISRGLKALARELDIPIIALSQLSRAVEMRAEKKPQLSDLRDSGSIEQDADIVMFLYRQEYYEPEDADLANFAELIIAKNRNGACGTIKLHFSKEIVLFQNYTGRKSYD